MTETDDPAGASRIEPDFAKILHGSSGRALSAER